MKKSVLYIAAMATFAAVMWETPTIAYAEPVSAVIAAPLETPVQAEAEEKTAEETVTAVSQVITVSSEEDALAESGPDPEIQRVEAEAKAQEAAKAEAQAAAESEAAARQNLVDYALQFVGNPYRAGGNDPHTGADCSGFTKYVMQHGAGINLQRTSGGQAAQGRTVSAAEMQPGDLIFYGNGSRVNHVAMYVGNGQIVHASTYKTGIKISNWNYRNPVRIASMF